MQIGKKIKKIEYPTRKPIPVELPKKTPAKKPVEVPEPVQVNDN